MDTLNVSDLSGRSMEVLLESDEELSLLEQMDQQETSTLFIPRNVLHSSVSDMPVCSGLGLRSSELYEANKSLQVCMSGNAENKVESGHCMEYNQNIQRLSSRSSINLEPSNCNNRQVRRSSDTAAEHFRK